MPGSEGAAGERQRGEGAPNEQAAAVSRARTCTDEPETPPSASSRLGSRTKSGFWGSRACARRASASAERVLAESRQDRCIGLYRAIPDANVRKRAQDHGTPDGAERRSRCALHGPKRTHALS